MHAVRSWFQGTAAVAFVVAAAAGAHAAPLVVWSVAGAGPADITGVRDAFRDHIGGGTVAGPNGSFGGLRREINWDGVPDAFASPNPLPPNFFNANSPRGAVFATPGTGFRVSANAGNPTGTPVAFGDLNPTYPGAFQTFSAQRLFGVLGSTVMDVSFFVPGTATPAAVTAFGVVFADNTGTAFPACASIQAFNGDASLGFYCSNAAPAGGLSFLGLSTTGGDVITRVRINLGTGLLGTTQASTNEVVVMDDFIYAEPRLQQVPEPAMLSLMFTAAAGVVMRARRRAR